MRPSRIGIVGIARLSLLLTLWSAAPAAAQDVPVVFLHGFNADGSGWQDTAARLSERTRIAPHVPDLAWREPFGEQALDLWRRPAYAGLSNGTVLVGHSNGGIVARESFRERPVGAVVTIGTPHRGAPILPNFGRWVTFGASTSSLVGSVVGAFSRPTDWSWVFSYVVGSLNWATDFSVWGVAYLGAVLGLDAALPVAGEMQPGSAYLTQLNTPANIEREVYGLGGRVGIVSIARNFYWAGPARALAPDHADEVATALYATAYGLLFWGNHVLTSADPLDFDAISQGLALVELAGHLLSIDPIYCQLVSSTALNQCLENDGLVPYTSQEYPGAPNLYLGFDNTGPVHTRERQQSDDILHDALVYFAGVPARQGGPQPLPPDDPDPPGTPPGEGDEEPEEDAGWSTTLERDDVLEAGDQLDSPGGFYHLTFQHDGNLVLYDDGWVALWASGTDGVEPGVVVMQRDGNLVLYDAADVPRWDTGTSGYPEAHLVLQDDGNAVVYAPDGTPLWASGTAR